MPTYSITEAATQITTATAGSPSLATRVMVALIKFTGTQTAGAVGNEAAYIRRIVSNPSGESNAVLPLVLSTVSVADTSAAPTDAELTSGISGIWSFFTG